MIYLQGEIIGVRQSKEFKKKDGTTGQNLEVDVKHEQERFIQTFSCPLDLQGTFEKGSEINVPVFARQMVSGQNQAFTMYSLNVDKFMEDVQQSEA